MATDKRPHSSRVVDGLINAPARAMLRAVGFTDADFAKPQIGIASTGSALTPCNMHINALADAAAMGANEAGAKAIVFHTITVADGISMGSPGMRYSLVSREVIADSIETVVCAEGFDGFVALGGCDKNMPGCAMAMARIDRPSVFVYGGSIQTGKERRDVISVFEAVGARAANRITDAQLKEVEETAIPVGLIVTEAVGRALNHDFSGVAVPEIRIEAFEKEDGEAELVIEDNGVETSRAVVGNGAGGSFGLTLMSGLAMQLGGKATISAREGGGTRVVVTFPLPRDEAGRA